MCDPHCSHIRGAGLLLLQGAVGDRWGSSIDGSLFQNKEKLFPFSDSLTRLFKVSRVEYKPNYPVIIRYMRAQQSIVQEDKLLVNKLSTKSSSFHSSRSLDKWKLRY